MNSADPAVWRGGDHRINLRLQIRPDPQQCPRKNLCLAGSGSIWNLAVNMPGTACFHRLGLSTGLNYNTHCAAVYTLALHPVH